MPISPRVRANQIHVVIKAVPAGGVNLFLARESGFFQYGMSHEKTLACPTEARCSARTMDAWHREMGVAPGEEMTPEQAGKAAASFMKGMAEEAAKQAEEAKRNAKERE